MGEWRDAALGDVIELKRGYDLPQRDRIPGTIPLISSSGRTDSHSVAMVKGPGVVTGRYGTLGQVFYVTEDFWPLNTTLYVCDFKGNDPLFISYFLGCIDFLAYSDKAAVPGLNRNHLHQARVRLPVDVREQRAIGEMLRVFDEKIQLHMRMNGTIEALAATLFRDWFSDFGPTSAKSLGEPAYLNDDLWSLFPDAFDESGIPDGWETSKIGLEAECVGGATPSTTDAALWNGEYNWATPKDLSLLKAPVLLSTARTLSEKGLARIGSGLLPVGSVLLSSRAPIGYLAITEIAVAINQGFIGLICKGRLPNVFVWQWVSANMESILQNANGSTFQEISKTNFRPLPVVVPSPSLIKAFEDVARPLYDRIRANETETIALAKTRNTLLPKLMSGEIALRNKEKETGEVL